MPAPVIDATPRGRTANSYIASTDDALALLASSAYYDAAAAAVAASAESATRKLLRAARLIDTLISPMGDATDANQAMQYPREGCPHPSGWWWESQSIPLPVQTAQAELWGWLCSRPATELDAFGGDATQNLASVTAGPVTVQFREHAPTAGPDFVDRFIRPLLASWGLAWGGGIARLTR